MSDMQVKIEQAKVLSLQKKYDESLNLYLELESNKSLLDNYSCAKIYAGIGNIHRVELQFSKAIKYFHQSLEYNPKNKLALKGLANSYRGIKDRQQELIWWLKYIEIDNKDFLALARIADAYRSLGNLVKAEQYYLLTLKYQSTNKFALMGLGDLYYKYKNYNQALIYWEQLLDLYPEFVNILTIVGNIYRFRRDFEKAMTYYQKVYKIAPHNNFVLYGIADTFRGLKEYKKSIPFWKELLERDQNNPKIMTRIADAYLVENMLEEAEEQYEIVWDCFQDKYAYVGKIRLTIKKHNLDQAYEMILELLTKFSSDIRICTIAIELLSLVGKSDETVSLLSRYHDISSNIELSNSLANANLL
ncbi:MAG: tetratricopeptide repeat protein [Brevinema sp.]